MPLTTDEAAANVFAVQAASLVVGASGSPAGTFSAASRCSRRRAASWREREPQAERVDVGNCTRTLGASLLVEIADELIERRHEARRRVSRGRLAAAGFAVFRALAAGTSWYRTSKPRAAA